MCRTALTDSPEGRAIGEQFNRGILVMIGAPYLVFGAVGAAIFRERLQAIGRRLWRRAATADPRPRA